jgi:hypothetical protein
MSISKKKHVIIFLPNGKEIQYSTVDMSDSNIEVAEEIVCEGNEVRVVLKEDKKTDGYAYVGMPYILNLW